MAKRTKHVFRDADEVCHIWAADREPRGDDHGRSSNCYFRGDTIYSYGSHYVLGQFYRNKRGQRDRVVINDYRHSVTTSGHIGSAFGAVRGLPGVRVYRSHYPASPADSITYMVRSQRDHYNSLFGKRKLGTGADYRNEHLAWRKELREFARSFKLKLPTKELKGLDRLLERVVVYADKVSSRAEKLRLAMLDPSKASAVDRRRALVKAARERAKATLRDRVVTKWKQNVEMTQEERRVFSAWRSDRRREHPTMLRINDGRVETSRGAMVTTVAGKMLFALYQRVMSAAPSINLNMSGETVFDHYITGDVVRDGKDATWWRWEPKQEVRVEHYVLNHINSNGDVQIGCHTLVKPEIDDFLERSGWLRQDQIKLVK